MTAKVFITDYAWPDVEVERRIIEGAGITLVAGPSAPASTEAIEALVRTHQPDAILTCWAPVLAAAVAASAPLKLVGRLGVGLDNIAVEACTARGVWVTNVPDYCVEEVSDHAIAFVLAWARGLVAFDREVRAGRWQPAGAKLRRLANLTCGIVGYGQIGGLTARKLAAFGCRLLIHAKTARAAEAGRSFVDLDTLLTESDVVILHVPLSDSTRHLIDRKRLARMKRGALLVNVSRGAVVDTSALTEALHGGHLNAAGLDVLESEPLVPKDLLSAPGIMLTPHVAFSSDASLLELRQRASEEAVRVLRGEAPRHPCNRPAR